MKIPLYPKPFYLIALLRAYIPAMLFLLACMYTAKAGTIIKHPPACGEDSMKITLLQNSKTHVITIKASANNSIVFSEASESTGKTYELFLFDMDSRLISRMRVRNRYVSLLEKPLKGNYMFEILSDDDHIGYGSIAVQ